MADRVTTLRRSSAAVYCRKHAFARFAPNLSTDAPVHEHSPGSWPATYGPHRLAMAVLVGRYYDPSTGQFLSVDPMVARTEEPYEYAAADPVNATDANGNITLGVCAQASWTYMIISLDIGECIVAVITGPNVGHIGFTSTIGLAGGIGLRASAGLYMELSNSDSLDALGGCFDYVAGTAVVGVGVGGVLFKSCNPFPPLVWGGEIGFVTGFGASLETGKSDTWVSHLSGTTANVAMLALLSKYPEDAWGYYAATADVLVTKAQANAHL